MKIVLSKHIIEKKIPLLRSLGWNITKSKIKKIIQNPKWKGFTEANQPTIMGLVDKMHILRVVYRQNNGIIFVITIHIARRGRYESTKNK